MVIGNTRPLQEALEQIETNPPTTTQTHEKTNRMPSIFMSVLFGGELNSLSKVIVWYTLAIILCRPHLLNADQSSCNPLTPVKSSTESAAHVFTVVFLAFLFAIAEFLGQTRRLKKQATWEAAYIEIEEPCDVMDMVDQALRASGFTGKEKRFRELPR